MTRVSSGEFRVCSPVVFSEPGQSIGVLQSNSLGKRRLFMDAEVRTGGFLIVLARDRVLEPKT
jgi:hypothetical protein